MTRFFLNEAIHYVKCYELVKYFRVVFVFSGSIHNLTGTWIYLSVGEYESFHRCQYQPPFTSEQISLTGQEQVKKGH